ncbi:hypothetical protein GCM10025864_34620 [Luteimicrobium album]|uniref:Uncharacterized protein n=1 Tax=Luteimicrobium album TaxID=1054550 RepID=A0ABQ6I6V9_9MICO|nr:hypothetical protein GCM10025864_34620 [Luteimicrobium album]
MVAGLAVVLRLSENCTWAPSVLRSAELDRTVAPSGTGARLAGRSGASAPAVDPAANVGSVVAAVDGAAVLATAGSSRSEPTFQTTPTTTAARTTANRTRAARCGEVVRRRALREGTEESFTRPTVPSPRSGPGTPDEDRPQATAVPTGKT